MFRDPYAWPALIVRYIRPYFRQFITLLILLLTSIGLQIVNPLIVQSFINTATSGGNQTILIHEAIVFFVFAIMNQGVSLGATYIGQDIGWRSTNALREDLALHLISLDQAFLNTRTPGEFIERIDGDITALANMFSEFVIRIFGSMLLLIGIIVVLFIESWIAGLAIILSSTAFFVAARIIQHRALLPGVAARQQAALLMGFLEESLRGRDDLRANGGGKYAVARYYHIARDLFHASRKAMMTRTLINIASLIFYAVTYGSIFAVSYLLFRNGAISLGTAYLFFQYNDMIQGPIDQMTRQIQEFQKAASSLQRIETLFRISSKIVGGNQFLPAHAFDVQFDQVGFHYGDSERPALSDISLSLPAGTVLGIVGRTGSGKTTFARLLSRLYDSTSGSLKYAGMPIESIDLEDLRDHVAVVSQDIHLFHATVRDNLTMFHRATSDEQLMQVITDMGMLPWFSRLPDGLDTMLDTQGNGLSAGESQLLAFIRVFLRNPSLVILDEPSSRLDLATEHMIEQAMQRLCKNRTAVIIAHRLATIQRADMILVLEDGSILEFGRRTILEQDPSSRYHQLLHYGSKEVLA